MVNAFGQSLWSRQSARVVDAGASEKVLLVVCEDITETRQLSKSLEQQALTDALTGLPNRMAFGQALDAVLVNARVNGARPAVLFMDLDRFKAVNDTLGHEAGDQLLREVSQRLRRVLRSSDVVCRLGGDEFQVLLPSVDSVDVAIAVAHSIRAAIEAPFEVGAQQVRIGCCIGVSCYPDDGVTSNDLTKHADTAMYRAKELGRNHVQLYTPALSAKLRARLAIESDLRDGIRAGRVATVFPTPVRPANPSASRCGGLGAMATSPAWVDRTGRIHSRRRGVRPDIGRHRLGVEGWLGGLGSIEGIGAHGASGGQCLSAGVCGSPAHD